MNNYTDDIVDATGTVNVHYHGCAHEINDDDLRHQEWRESRDKNFGYDGTCLFNLDISLSSMIAVHIEEFKTAGNHHYPSIMTEDEWQNIIDDIELGFRLYGQLDAWDLTHAHNENMRIVNKAQDLFHKHFFSLWI